MDANFWLQRWEKNEIAFHEKEANPLLVRHFKKLSLAKGSRVFIPLCGKTRDISWLLKKGRRIAGAELSEKAVRQLFLDLKVEPKVTALGRLNHYSAPNIDIFAGDIFELSRECLGPVDAVYDRAALVALPAEMRDRYAAHLKELTNRAPQLLICYDYDQSLQEGPPFSISDQEVSRHYKDNYEEMVLLENRDLPGGLKGKCAAREKVWFLFRGAI